MRLVIITSAMSFYKLALLLLFILPLCSAQSTYYVTPTPDTPCPGEPCLSFVEHTKQGGGHLENATLVFLPGTHTIESSIEIGNLASLMLLGKSSSLSQVTSRISCSQHASISFQYIENLFISDLGIVSCGSEDYGAAVVAEMVRNLTISNCLFQNNTYSSSGGALAVVSSSLAVSQTTFESNSASCNGGSVYIQNGVANFTGNQFKNNQANYGGGVAIYTDSIGCFTENVFMNNGGGSGYIENSVVNFTENQFESNQANIYGGGVYIENSVANFIGNQFENNRAEYTNSVEYFAENVFLVNDGGGVYIRNSVAKFTANEFENNQANYGGGVALHNNSVGYFTENAFMNNVAKPLGGGGIARSGGGGVDVYSSSKASFLYNTLIENTAVDDGGAVIVGFESSVEFYGNIFVDNSAIRSGGGVAIQVNSIADFTDNNFINNSNSDTWEVEIDTTSTATFTNNKFINSTGYAIYGSTNNTPSIYYIKSSPDTPCSESPCHTLSKYLRMANQYFTLNTTLVLLPGDHLLEGKLLVRDILALTLIGDGNSSRLSTRIVCASTTVFFHLQNISEVNIHAVGFVSCGNANFSAVSLLALLRISISNCTFQNSIGGALSVTHTNTLLLTHSSFIDNFSPAVGGGVNVLSVISAFFHSNSFIGNRAGSSGGAIFIADSTVHFSGKTHFTANSGQLFGGAIAIVNSTVSYRGDTTFDKNTANFGGAVYAVQCYLNFEGENVFKENTASRDGGGLLLTSDSRYYLHPNTTISFANNTAMQNGGAIKVDVSNQLVYCRETSLSFTLNECFFQLNSNTNIKFYGQLHNFNVRMNFNNNTAGDGGGDIYGGAVDNCELQSVHTECCDFQSSGNVLDCIITGDCYMAPETLDVSSDPLRICLCKNNEANCDSSSITKRAYPGGKFTVSVIALGQRNGNVSAVIQADLTQRNIEFDTFQYKQNTNNMCTDIEYTVFSSESVEPIQENITLYAQGPCPREGRSLEIKVKILQCPHGFELSNNRRKCICSKRLANFTDNTCNIADETILRPYGASFWVGYSNENNGLIFYPQCPFDYCTTEEIYMSVDSSDVQCNYNRTGKLCGECIETLSLVLGSSRCLQCSNSHLALLAAFAFAGIALVFFLFLLKLTVAVGTINGLIFYANVVQVNSAVFFRPGTTNILTVFIAWLNLDLGIETCFYDGMDAYAKTWLQFLFPIYVWTLVGIIILFSHFSQMISRLLGKNPIAVLCTLFLLSYAKILHTIIAVLSFVTLEYPKRHQTVWLYNGNITYSTGLHVPLFVVALSTLLFLFLPFSLLLFCGQWLQGKCDSRVFSWISKPSVKSILDAYHAPYVSKYRYWTGLLLLTRSSLFLIFAFNALGDPHVNLFCITTVTLAIITFGFVAERIYENRYLGALEASFIINLGILAAATTSFDQVALTYTSVSIAFATFIGIVVYHSHLQLKDNKVLKKIANVMPDTFHRRNKCALNVEDIDKVLTTTTTSIVSLREPLLEDEI